MKRPPAPTRILMLKAHSAGIGDLLRSSAAWRVLKNAYPGAELHLLLFSREPGYSSEELIRDHHLLNGFAVVDKRTKGRHGWHQFWAQVKKIRRQVQPDLVIDFESSGIRTSLVALAEAYRRGARTVGINSVPGRGLFYTLSSPSPRKFAQRHGFPWPMNYTDRDFVVLTALGLERNGCPIELRETPAGQLARADLRQHYGLQDSDRLLGLNIGCGTPDALPKRPDLTLLSELVAVLQRDHGFRLVLMGAPFEQSINQEFCALHQQRCTSPIIDLAGKTTLSGLTGIINACDLFISSDSGPYHMGVGLRVPTLAIFRWDNSAHFHDDPWVRCCVVAGIEQLPNLRQAAEQLLTWATLHRPNGGRIIESSNDAERINPSQPASL